MRLMCVSAMANPSPGLTLGRTSQIERLVFHVTSLRTTRRQALRFLSFAAVGSAIAAPAFSSVTVAGAQTLVQSQMQKSIHFCKNSASRSSN
jgi:hypothetical protein